jgi:hypothetical protein
MAQAFGSSSWLKCKAQVGSSIWLKHVYHFMAQTLPQLVQTAHAAVWLYMNSHVFVIYKSWCRKHMQPIMIACQYCMIDFTG